MIRGAKKLGVRLLVGLLVIAMAAFGLESFFFYGADQSALEINGEEVSRAQLDNAVVSYRNNLVGNYGQQFVDNLGPEIIAASARQQLIQQVLLRQQAEEYGLVASDAMVNRLLAELPNFQVDGRFSIETLQGYLASNRLSLAQFQDNLRAGMGQDLLVNSVVSSQVPHQKVLDLTAGLMFVSVDVLYADIAIAALAQDITPAEEQLVAYYADHSSDYIEPQSASFSYLRLALENFLDRIEQPDDEALELAYQEYLAEQVTREEYQASHILITISGRSDQEAAGLARELRARIDEGEDFASLAREYSEDPGSAREGGSLGVVTLDSLVPEFADQLRLMQAGEISQPVQSDFGYHIIRLDADAQSNLPTLEEMRARLSEQLVTRQARAAYGNALEQLRNLTGGAANLEAAAQTLELEIALTPQLTRQGAAGADADDMPAGLFVQPEVLEAGFTTEVIEQGLASEVVDLGEEAVVLLLDNYMPQRQLALDEVRQQLITAVTNSQASTRANALAEAITGLQPTLDEQADKGTFLASGKWKDKLKEQMVEGGALDSLQQAMRRVAFLRLQDLTRIAGPAQQDPSANRLRNTVFAGALEAGVLMQQMNSDGGVVYVIEDVARPGYNELDAQQQLQVRQALQHADSAAFRSQLIALLTQQADIH